MQRFRFGPRSLAAAIGSALTGAALAQPPAHLPPSTATAAPVGTGLNSPTRSQARAIQQLLPGTHLAPGGVTGVTGLTFRGAPASLNPTSPWPAASIDFASYDIYLARAAVPAGTPLSATFADNIVPGSEVLVRSGPLTIPTGAWAASAWGTFTFAFSAPFSVAPSNDYILTIRHTGSGLTGPGADFYMDTVPPSGLYQDAIVATASGYTATSGLAQGAFIVTRFQTIPAPGAGLALAAAGLLAMRRRR